MREPAEPARDPSRSAEAARHPRHCRHELATGRRARSAPADLKSAAAAMDEARAALKKADYRRGGPAADQSSALS